MACFPGLHELLPTPRQDGEGADASLGRPVFVVLGQLASFTCTWAYLSLRAIPFRLVVFLP